MKHTIRTAAFFFVTAAALVAQSSANNQDSKNVQLIALNATKNLPDFLPVAPVQNPQPEPRLKSDAASSDFTNPIQPGTLAPAHILKPGSMPGQTALTASSKPTAGGNSWFMSGPNALPAYVRMDPNANYELQKYGAAPVAVQFSFGKK